MTLPADPGAIAARRDAFLAAVVAAEPGLEPPELDLARVVADHVRAAEFPVAAVVTAWQLIRDRPFGPTVERALDQLARAGRPPAEEVGPEDLTAALVTLPLVARDWLNDRNVITAAYHLARLVDTAPANHWAAVGVSLVAACFLRGQIDPIPEVAAAFRANDAPASLLAAVQRVPVWARRPEVVTGDFEEVLWVTRHLGDPAKVEAAVMERGAVVRLVARALLAAKAAGKT